MLQKNHHYKLKVNAGTSVLTYSCEVLEIDSYFIKIKDKFDNIENICLNAIISYEEVSE